MNNLEEKRATRRQADMASVIALAELLRDIAASPAHYSQDVVLCAALRSQGALAKHPAPDKAVYAMSLNHQRYIAQLALGNYSCLDELRRLALNALWVEETKSKKGHKNTKIGLATRVRELENENAMLKHDLALLQTAYDRRCLQARTYASASDNATQELCIKEQRELDALFSLRNRPVDTSNVVHINDARKL